MTHVLTSRPLAGSSFPGSASQAIIGRLSGYITVQRHGANDGMSFPFRATSNAASALVCSRPLPRRHSDEKAEARHHGLWRGETCRRRRPGTHTACSRGTAIRTGRSLDDQTKRLVPAARFGRSGNFHAQIAEACLRERSKEHARQPCGLCLDAGPMGGIRR